MTTDRLYRVTVNDGGKVRKFVGRFVCRVGDTLWFLTKGDTKDTLHGMRIYEAKVATVAYNKYGEPTDGESVALVTQRTPNRKDRTMKNPFMCNVENGRLSKSQIRSREAIAAACGGEFVFANLPEGPRSWFQAENAGEPFNRKFAAAIRKAMSAAD